MKKTQPWGITYPDSGDSINQAPAQMQAMAESIDTAVGKIANKPPITYAVAKQLDPNQQPTADYTATEIGFNGPRTLNLGIPRAPRIKGVTSEQLDPAQSPTAATGTDAHGDYSLRLGLPRQRRLTLGEITSVDSTQPATGSLTTDAHGDQTLNLTLPRGRDGAPATFATGQGIKGTGAADNPLTLSPFPLTRITITHGKTGTLANQQSIYLGSAEIKASQIVARISFDYGLSYNNNEFMFTTRTTGNTLYLWLTSTRTVSMPIDLTYLTPVAITLIDLLAVQEQ